MLENKEGRGIMTKGKVKATEQIDEVEAHFRRKIEGIDHIISEVRQDIL